METLATNVQTIDLREPIPGYVLGERLGAGGFGEVWRAEAPGGLAKAVKIVYGQMHGDRAGQELKALQKIKEVRHPMLLSLERIESVADHLVIVMELADGSLRDRQAERQAAGLPGIPREELLAYLRDAADAMDYLVEHHSLLHLDIKPENLLLVADRVKVADFGLMRDLDDTNASLINGMTPLYAAPEVFDGKPQRQSDQYSLAIVYQELLTGQPPFAGRTAAQLVSQHLHSQPILKSLPTFDQPVIARALSKVAERRFPNCRALVDELANAPRTVERSQPRREWGENSEGHDTWRNAAGATTTRTGRLAQTDLVSLVFPASTDIHNLPPLTLEADQAFARPTLFIGVGGMGTRVLCRLKHRLREKFGNIEDAPALQFLAIETDPQSLAEMTSQGQEGGLRFHESLLLALRDPQDYRANASSLLEWMNRRWLYNIPRSRKTEGIRALGRLAFVDHFGPIVDMLHSALAMAMAPESVELTTRRTGLRFATGAPRVYVVGSTTGGTGGGMLLDLGYTLRTLFKKMNIADDLLCGILACAAPLRAKARDLAVANTVALLGELKQFSSDRYPGEPACDLPASSGQPPFASTYLVQFSGSSDEALFQRSADDIADYLLLNTVTPAAMFFERCREESNTTGQQDLAATRSFGLSWIDCQSNNFMSIAAEVLIGALFTQWAEFTHDSRHSQPGSREGIEDKAQALAARFSEMFGLNSLRVVEEATALIERELGQDARQFMRKSLNDIWVQSSHINADERVSAVIASVDGMIGASRDTPTAGQQKSLSAILDRQLLVKSRNTQLAMREWLAKLVDTPALRVAGARHACAWLVRHFEQLEGAASDQLDRLKRDIDRLKASLRQAGAVPAVDAEERVLVGVNSKMFQDLSEYATVTLHAASYRRTIRVWQVLREATLDCERRLRSLTQGLQALVSEFPAPSSMASISAGAAQTDHSRLNAFQNRLPQLVVALDRRLERTHLGQLLVLDELSMGGGIDLENLSRGVGRQAKVVVRGHFQGTTAAETSAPGSYDAEQFQDCVNRALPHLTSCGGAKRVLVKLPTDGDLDVATLSQDARLAKESATLFTEGEGRVAVCFEVEQIPLDNIAVSLIRNRGDYFDLAARLHTRIDVEWKPFDPVATTAESPPAE